MSHEEFLQLGNVRYYPALRRLVCVHGQELTLRSQSLEVLHLLAENANELITKDKIFDVIWKNVNVTDDSLVQCISNIRRQLEDSERKILQTLPKRGYRLRTTHSSRFSKPGDNTDAASTEPLIPVNPPPDRPAIAVMCFQNIGTEATGNIIAAGLTTDIHFNLARMSSLFVVGQASASNLQHLPAHEVGLCLGVRYLIYGNTQRSAKSMRATISLVEAESNRVLWTEQYQKQLGDFLQLQDEITHDVVTALDHCIEQQEIKRAFSSSPGNLHAWELYHQGLWYCRQTNQASIDAASALLNQSLALDPTFAPAYAALSATFIHRIFVNKGASTSDHADSALDYAYQCLEHDDQSGWGYWALGRAMYMKRQYGQAMEALDLSIKYKPNFSWSHHARSMVYSSGVNGEQALLAANQALRLSPADPNRFAFLSAKTMAYIRLEDFKEAAIWGIQAAREPKAYHLTYVVAAIALELNGQTSEARKHIAKAFKTSPEFNIKNYLETIPHHNDLSSGNSRIVKALEHLSVPCKSY